MSLVLDTPIQTGDLDPNASTYGEVKIIRFSHDAVNRLCELVTQEGNTVDGVWVAGVSRAQRFVIYDKKDKNGDPVPGEQHYTDITSKTMTDAGMTDTDPIYGGVAYNLYDWLIQNTAYVGTYT